MLILAIVLFLAAVVCGFFLLTAILQDRPVNQKAKAFHGIFAGLGLLIMIVYMLTFMSGQPSLFIASLVILIGAAVGGLTLVTLARKVKKVPKLAVLVHPIIAIAGLIALIIYVMP
ncbi:hypothetical protein [Legionella parisiensis]|uniref:Uncharacterized protein n=1 Tax=Legionella parisiensis TaxID=45071 RepID=A0A1E5JSA2_9GAMM|nr:hypothetical protein [Legionella parisiensis]KTD42156.1 hypothetical protein Lpar_3473 [Legionella parisiensis]OEH47416.1 hypothetical protein lpari_01584 [Legionella parisiensis]STX75276.1 Uncharacterised protein [Legionella parisiensis]